MYNTVHECDNQISLVCCLPTCMYNVNKFVCGFLPHHMHMYAHTHTYTHTCTHTLAASKAHIPNISTLLNNRAACYLKNGNTRGCIDDCTNSLELVPVNLKALLRRARAYEGMEKLIYNIYYTSTVNLEDFVVKYFRS